MNRKVFVVLVLLAAAGLAAFANGAGETSVTLTGTLELEGGSGFATLKTGPETWRLMVPHMYDYDVPVRSGDTITVTGLEMPGPRWDREDAERYLMVQKAVIAGREYTLPGGYGQGGMMGGGYGRGMMGGMMGGGMMGGGYGRGGMMGGGWGDNRGRARGSWF